MPVICNNPVAAPESRKPPVRGAAITAVACSPSVTEREFEVYRCLVSGQSNRDIGEHMRLSNKTVSAYKMKIMRKLGARNIRDLIELAREGEPA